MNQESLITAEVRGNVLLIGVNRPAERNLFNMATIEALAAAYGRLEQDPELRCGVLFANGKHFTLGLDLADVVPALTQGDLTFPEGSFNPWGTSPPYRQKPLVCAVHGLCLTLGIELALAADIRIAATGTRFAQLEVKRGIYPFGGATVRFVREVGWGNAMRYLLTGDEFSAEEAFRMGLVQEVVEPERLLPRAIELAESVARQAPFGVRATIRSARQAWLEGEKAAMADLFPALKDLLETEDAREGVQSFLERRSGNFRGR
ncbi:MAG TPA: crotonase/enoyl-CoA hydratase family protein [Bacillota bacterium]